MSYEPTLVINRGDLLKHKNRLENWELEKEEDRDVFKFLNTESEYKYPPKIGGIELIICQPELTSFNTRVRKALYELNVEFSTSN